MAGLMKKHSGKAGLPPGTLVHVGEKRVGEPAISIIHYDESCVNERTVAAPDECRQYINRSTVTWINVTRLHDTVLLQELGDVFDIHPLVLEDIVNTGQRPKLEEHGQSIFCVAKMLYGDADTGEVVAEQVSFVLKKGVLLTFQEVEGDVFDIIRSRIRAGEGRIRRTGCDYLFYALLDAIVDNYFAVLENVGDRIESVQERVLQKPEARILEKIHRLRRDMIFMRKNLWPLREVVSGLERTENRLIPADLAPYLRDVYEHTVQVIDNVEMLRDMLSGALDTYMTAAGNRMNEVMKVLTIIATIFIPLTFIAGIYGMNFENMPELKWPLGYAAIWLVMLLVTLGMVLFFRRKKWL